MVNEILVGDCVESMRAMSDKSVNCCVTSPPYFGLRDYGHAGQIGLEPTPDAYVAKMVEVFREVRRVLRDDGTLWLNLGDSYCSIGHKKSSSGYGTTGLAGGKAQEHTPLRRENNVPGLKHKDLIGIPWRVAFALQSDGWYLRQDIIWHKPNPMPESVRDRCTKSHEYIFLLSKQEKYHFDSEAMKEPSTASEYDRTKRAANRMAGTRYLTEGLKQTKVGATMGQASGTRNKRSVWTVTTRSFKGAHFATFPPDLIEPCVLAGCPAGGTVLDPFGGSGTTAMVAQRHGRNSVICELNPEYAKLAEDRIAADRAKQLKAIL